MLSDNPVYQLLEFQMYITYVLPYQKDGRECVYIKWQTNKNLKKSKERATQNKSHASSKSQTKTIWLTRLSEVMENKGKSHHRDPAMVNIKKQKARQLFIKNHVH